MTAETVRQAKRWDDTVAAYAEAGFCRLCASQAAHGHAVGFELVRPVCASCSGLQTPILSLPGGRRRPANAAVWARSDPGPN